MGMKRRRMLMLLLAACLILPLAGCRQRIETAPAASARISDEAAAGETGEEAKTDAADADGSGERTRENPESSRKEYDEHASAEIAPGTERLLHSEGEGSGAPVAESDAEKTASQAREDAEETATQTAAAAEADKKAASPEGEEADSALTYYTVLLQDRLGSLFECQRLTVYWETAQDHVTVHKSSLEHALMMDAGAYDASARLLPENLRVDDGWIARKQPDMIVKIVPGATLENGAANSVRDALLMRPGWSAIPAVRAGKVLLLSEDLLASQRLRTAAALLIAKCAYPDVFADVDAAQAVSSLLEEETGGASAGRFYFPDF